MADGVIFNLTETSYIEAVWFVSWRDTDWMALVYRDSAEAPWRLTYRFRYYAPGRTDAFQSGDKKSVYDARTKDGSDASRVSAVDVCDRAAAALVKDAGATCSKVIVQGDTDRYTDLLVKQPWAHIKVAAPAPGGTQ